MVNFLAFISFALFRSLMPLGLFMFYINDTTHASMWNEAMKGST